MSCERTEHNNQRRNIFYEKDRKTHTNLRLSYMQELSMTTTKTKWELMLI